MSFFKKIFGKEKNENQVQDKNKLPWINPADNPWGLKLLDLRPIALTMISTSQNPQMATNAVSYGGEDGTIFWEQKTESSKTIDANITFSVDKKLQAGVLFIPDTMEHKWAIYFDGCNLIFVRSWLRKVLVVAETIQEKNHLHVKRIKGEFTQNESAEFTIALLNFLLISHCVQEIVPAPLPFNLENNLEGAGYWAFSTYGKMAQLGVFNDLFIPTTLKPIRSHSLLHIAVARGDLKDITIQANNGVDVNCLAGDGLAPLHWSIAAETADSMRKLLDLGADPNVRSFEGATPLMNAVQSNRIDKINLLLNSGADVNAIDDRGFTALHRAAERGHIDAVKILLQNKAEKGIVAAGHTAMSLATLTRQNEIIALLGE